MTDPTETTSRAAGPESWAHAGLAALLLILGGCLAFPGAVLMSWACRLSPELRAKLDDRLAPMVVRFLGRRR